MSVEITETLGERIKQTRGNMSLVEFANLLGIGKSSLSLYEKNERMPPADFFIRMDALLHIDSVWLLTGKGAASTGEEMTSDEAALLWNYRRCTQEAQAVLTQTALLLPKNGGGVADEKTG
ncbi:MAG: XRE family transcriptional regulator [Methylovulum sp.]|nr:MAG: XRE family transcriptional regulator [Methylovulum sp.]